jgi:hypothetical protein
MFTRSMFVGLMLATLTAVPRVVDAAPILWTLNLDPALGISGSFAFDSDTLTYSDVNITVTSPAVIFDSSDVSLWSGPGFLELRNTSLGLTINFGVIKGEGLPSDQGGTVAVPQIAIFNCSLDVACAGNIYSDVGSVTSAPEPTAMLLLGTGLLGAGMRRWRQKRT